MDGSNDSDISATATQIAAHPLAYFIVSQLRAACELRDVGRYRARRTGLPFLEQGNCGTDLPGGAVTALKTVMLKEGGLHGMQLRLAGQALNGGDVITIMHRGQAETGVDALAVDQDGAGSTLAVIAPLLRASHTQVVTQEVEQRYPGIDLQLMRLAVDSQAASDRMRNSGFVIA